MALLNIQNSGPETPFNVFVLGFRPFFLTAGIFSVISMLLWLLVYSVGVPFPMKGLSHFHWHAHEMIYGYSMAVASGFLLTAIKNWTGVQTLQHRGLMLLTLLWVSSRVAALFGTEWMVLATLFDLAYNLFLAVAVTLPIVKVKQWKQIGIVSKIYLLGLFNLFFYLGLFNVLDMGIYWGIYGGLFVIIALIMTMGRRVMPFFIEKGVGYPVQLKNSKFLDVSSLVLFLALSISDVFLLNMQLSAYLAMPLVVVSLLRLYNWYTTGIWKAPLLWGLYVAFIFITLGFLLFALQPYSSLATRSLALHAFAVGGIGLVTVSMMSRVTLGHTGRNVMLPSPWINVIQWLLVTGALLRVVFPVLLPQFYSYHIISSQLLWIAAFTLFVIVNFPILTRPRIDGAPG